MKKLGVVLFMAAAAVAAEVNTLTLGEAVDRALAANPDLIVARIEEQKADAEVQAARDPFFPKILVGTGLAYSSGFPLSVEGAAPSIVQAQGIASIINRPERHRLAVAREQADGTSLDTEATQREVVLQTTELYLRAESATRQSSAAQAQVASLERVAEAVRLRVDAGRELPIELKRAELDLARARQRAEAFEFGRADAEASLAAVLGFEAGDSIRTVPTEAPSARLPLSEDEAVRLALVDNPALGRLESSLAAARLRVRAEGSAKLPRVNLIAQYSMLSRFNNYDRFFNDFQRHNGQIGVSVEVPVFAGPAVKARTEQASADVTRLRTEFDSSRRSIALEARREFRDLRSAETAEEVAQLDLDLARDNLTLLLAQMSEGRASILDVEAARYLENEKWIAFYASHLALETARFRLLSRTGTLLASLR